MVPNIDVNRYRRYFQDSRNVVNYRNWVCHLTLSPKCLLSQRIPPLLVPVAVRQLSPAPLRLSLPPPPPASLHRSGEPMSQCPTATWKPPEEVSPALLRLQLHPPLPPFDPSPTPVALLPFLSLFGPFCALTHSLARRAHFTVTPSLPAGSLALARSLVALPFLTEFRALSPFTFQPSHFLAVTAAQQSL